MMYGYRIVYERGPHSWGAYVPSLPGLGVVGATRAEVEARIGPALLLHLEGLREDALERGENPERVGFRD